MIIFGFRLSGSWLLAQPPGLASRLERRPGPLPGRSGEPGTAAGAPEVPGMSQVSQGAPRTSGMGPAPRTGPLQPNIRPVAKIDKIPMKKTLQKKPKLYTDLWLGPPPLKKT